MDHKMRETKKNTGKTKGSSKDMGANKKVSAVPGEWLYFSPETVTVRQLADLLPENSYEVEIWEDAAVLEIDMNDAGTVDIEQTEIHPKDEITKRFAEEHHCKSVFLVTFFPESYEQAKSVMNYILEGNGGVFCGDTEDMTPIIEKA